MLYNYTELMAMCAMSLITSFTQAQTHPHTPRPQQRHTDPSLAAHCLSMRSLAFSARARIVEGLLNLSV